MAGKAKGKTIKRNSRKERRETDEVKKNASRQETDEAKGKASKRNSRTERQETDETKKRLVEEMAE